MVLADSIKYANDDWVSLLLVVQVAGIVVNFLTTKTITKNGGLGTAISKVSNFVLKTFLTALLGPVRSLASPLLHLVHLELAKPRWLPW